MRPQERQVLIIEVVPFDLDHFCGTQQVCEISGFYAPNWELLHQRSLTSSASGTSSAFAIFVARPIVGEYQPRSTSPSDLASIGTDFPSVRPRVTIFPARASIDSFCSSLTLRTFLPNAWDAASAF